MKKGKFIVIEGLDGTGKTTQIRRLAQSLEAQGETVFVTAEPTDFPSGKLIRRVLSGEVPSSPWSTAALFLADRIRHCADPENGIAAHLAKGETVITDRYYFSTFAYQGYETDLDWTMRMHYDCPELIRPDLVLFLTMSAEKCMARITASRPAEAIEIYENTEALAKISRQFDRVFDRLKDREKVVYIDADGTVEEVAERVRAALPIIPKGKRHESH